MLGIVERNEVISACVALHSGRKAEERVLVSQLLTHGRPKELLGDSRAPPNGVFRQLLVDEQVDPPSFGIAGCDIPQALASTEEFDQIATSVAVYRGGACLHVRTHFDVRVE